MNQFKLLDVDLMFSPRLAAKKAFYVGRKPRKQTKPLAKPEKSTQMALTAGRWYVLERTVGDDQRNTLIVIEGDALNQYLKPKKRGHVYWRIVGEACPTEAEAVDLAAAWGGMIALQDPGKAPNRQGTREEVKRLQALEKQLGLTGKDKAPLGEKERDLVWSILKQYARYEPNTLSPKQWVFISKFYSQLELRLQKRAAYRAKGRGNE